MKKEDYNKAITTLRFLMVELSASLQDPEPSQDILLKLYKVRGKCADLIQYHREKGITVKLK